ncbi:MAG: hypothetical protein ACI9M6_001990, partial [Hydrogenophaga sp.]
MSAVARAMVYRCVVALRGRERPTLPLRPSEDVARQVFAAAKLGQPAIDI